VLPLRYTYDAEMDTTNSLHISAYYDELETLVRDIKCKLILNESKYSNLKRKSILHSPLFYYFNAGLQCGTAENGKCLLQIYAKKRKNVALLQIIAE